MAFICFCCVSNRSLRAAILVPESGVEAAMTEVAAALAAFGVPVRQFRQTLAQCPFLPQWLYVVSSWLPSLRECPVDPQTEHLPRMTFCHCLQMSFLSVIPLNCLSNREASMSMALGSKPDPSPVDEEDEEVPLSWSLAFFRSFNAISILLP